MAYGIPPKKEKKGKKDKRERKNHGARSIRYIPIFLLCIYNLFQRALALRSQHQALLTYEYLQGCHHGLSNCFFWLFITHNFGLVAVIACLIFHIGRLATLVAGRAFLFCVNTFSPPFTPSNSSHDAEC